MTRFDAPYGRYAGIYDRLGQRRFGEIVARTTLSWLGDRGVYPGRALDLACGTGAATLVFAEAGIVTIGLDQSPTMLTKAAACAAERAVQVEWMEADMRDFAITPPVDLVTCFFDSMNYLADLADVRRVFRSTEQAVEADGWFVFDLNTTHRFADQWDRVTLIAADDPDLFVTYRSWFDHVTQLSPLQLTAFERTETGLWSRFDEEHVERAFDLAEIEQTLNDTGFELVEQSAYAEGSGDLLGPVTPNTDRVILFARRATDATFEPS